MATYYAAMRNSYMYLKSLSEKMWSFFFTLWMPSLSMKPEIILSGKEFSQIILFAYSRTCACNHSKWGKCLFIQGCSRLWTLIKCEIYYYFLVCTNIGEVETHSCLLWVYKPSAYNPQQFKNGRKRGRKLGSCSFMPRFKFCICYLEIVWMWSPFGDSLSSFGKCQS